MPDAVPSEYERVYQLCKLQAATDGAFAEPLLQQTFAAAWDLCFSMVGLIWPAQEFKESICINECGTFTLSRQPSSEVKIYDGYRLVAVLPPSLEITRCTPALCCLCHPYAVYTVGQNGCSLPPRFVEAIMRLFAYMLENRGDSEMSDQILAKCGALTFLGPDLAYVR